LLQLPTTYRLCRDPSHENTTSEESAFEGAEAVDASAAESCVFAYSKEAGDGLAAFGEDAAGQVGLGAAQAFPAEDELADGDERIGFGIVNFLEFAHADAVTPVGSEIGDAPELVVVVESFAALNVTIR
jgi:hypothetical protein